MPEDISTVPEYGFNDHHHVGKAKETPVDPNHKASKEVKDKVWEMIQNGYSPTEDDFPIPEGHIGVEVPEEYVKAAAHAALMFMKKMGCREGFSVIVDPQAPQIVIQYLYPTVLEVPGRPAGYSQKSNCLATYMALQHQKRSDFLPDNVGTVAAEMFIKRLDEVLKLA